MKNSIIITIIILITANLSAQTDTIFYFKDNKILVKEENGELKVQIINDKTDSAETVLFEGNYGENQSSEVSFNFTFSKLVKKEPEKIKKKVMYAHGQGFGLGYAALSSHNLKLDNNKDAVLSHAIETNFNFVSINVPFSQKNNWLFATSFGMKGYRFNSDNNTAFQIENGRTIQIAAPNDVHYSQSYLSIMYLTATPMIEWQPFGRTAFFVHAGTEIGVKLITRSYIYFREDGKKQMKEIDKGLNVNPFDVSLKIGLGVGDVCFYAKYGLTRLFKQGKGADVVPVSFGIVFNFLSY